MTTIRTENLYPDIPPPRRRGFSDGGHNFNRLVT